MSRAIGGRQAQAKGADFEAWLDQQHDRAEQTGLLAWSRHVSPKIRFVGQGTRARPIIVGKALADYVGQTKTGISIVIEAKSRNSDSFRLNEIEPHQQKHLNACATRNGIALLLLEFRPKNVPGQVFQYPKRFAVPWLSVPWKVKRSAESVSVEDLTGWEVADSCYLSKFIEP